MYKINYSEKNTFENCLKKVIFMTNNLLMATVSDYRILFDKIEEACFWNLMTDSITFNDYVDMDDECLLQMCYKTNKIYINGTLCG